MLMSAADYRESLRRLRPVVYVDGRRIESVADEPLLAPGVNSIGVSYDLALREPTQHLMRTESPDFDGPINRMLAIPRTSADLLNKLEATRLVCQETLGTASLLHSRPPAMRSPRSSTAPRASTPKPAPTITRACARISGVSTPTTSRSASR